jgi:hypothetical protein
MPRQIHRVMKDTQYLDSRRFLVSVNAEQNEMPAAPAGTSDVERAKVLADLFAPLDAHRRGTAVQRDERRSGFRHRHALELRQTAPSSG